MTTFILGPAICSRCRLHVWLDTDKRWCGPEGLPHSCGKKAWYTRSRWFQVARVTWAGK